MTLNYVTLTITEQDAGQDAGTGNVIIAPTGQVTAAGVTVVSTVPVVRSLSAGSVSVQLVACDNAGTTPAAGFWAYSIMLPGASSPQMYLVNFANGAMQRLDQLTPVVPLTTFGPAGGSGVTSFNGRAGAVAPASGDYTAAETGSLAAKANSTSVPAGGLVAKTAVLTDGSSVPIDVSLGNVFYWTLGGANHTLAAPSNLADGQTFTVVIKYGGSFTPLFNAIYDFGPGAPTWSAANGKTDRVAFAYDAAANGNAGACQCLNSGGLGYTS